MSGHFFANCMLIFHKTEVQMVILRCLTGLHLDWFRHYGLRCRWRPCTCLANSQKIATDKWPFCDHIWTFFANCMFIFHKTEIQKVILKCWTSLNSKWFRSYDTKMQEMQMSVFVQNRQKSEMEIFALCVITFEPIRF